MQVRPILCIFCVAFACVLDPVMALAQSAANTVEITAKPDAASMPPQDCADCPEMVVIPAGTHTVFGDQLKETKVSIATFALGKTPVTQGQWKALMGDNPSHFTKCGDACPVESVSWYDAQDYVQRLSEKTGQAYRLPSELEWEYACMAGSQTTYCGGEDADKVAWYRENSTSATHPVAKKKANGFGLYDMSGNVWEWMGDCWKGDCSIGRVLRGGSYGNGPGYLRAAERLGGAASYRYFFGGFRVARSVLENRLSLGATIPSQQH